MIKLHLSIRHIAAPKYLTQVDVAKLSGVSRHTINKLWAGQNIRNCHFDTIEQIAAALDCSPLDFFSVTDEPN